jgi:proline iminopeptidase
LRYEAAAMNVPLPDTLTPQSRGKALVQLHYLANGCFFDADDILRRLRALQTIPTIVVQGARDRICPPAAARSVAAAIPGAELVLLADEGHAASAELMASALIDALDRVAEKYGNS